mmetsp:Transcript_9720/g.24439  ORF Transcript_9720/g.24439 Transcript_9720/m.24439 type:complete len:238 (-) Transcript_9720:1060-1773(-)
MGAGVRHGASRVIIVTTDHNDRNMRHGRLGVAMRNRGLHSTSRDRHDFRRLSPSGDRTGKRSAVRAVGTSGIIFASLRSADGGRQRVEPHRSRMRDTRIEPLVSGARRLGRALREFHRRQREARLTMNAHCRYVGRRDLRRHVRVALVLTSLPIEAKSAELHRIRDRGMNQRRAPVFDLVHDLLDDYRLVRCIQPKLLHHLLRQRLRHVHLGVERKLDPLDGSLHGDVDRHPKPHRR